jgi:hypothetical protein
MGERTDAYCLTTTSLLEEASFRAKHLGSSPVLLPVAETVSANDNTTADGDPAP